jgi:hypothetical protein
MDELMKVVYQTLGVQPKPEPPYPFCVHKDKCIASGRCERKVNGEPWCCAD